MGFKKVKVQLAVKLNQKRQDAIAELMAIGYDRNEAIEIVDTYEVNSSEFTREAVDDYEGVEMEAF